jgi:hypothetical protein
MNRRHNLRKLQNEEALKSAQESADMCCGVNAPNLSELSIENVLQVRNDFLANVAFNGLSSHEDIIVVLNYMTRYVYRATAV